MIHITVQQAAKKRGIKKAYQLQTEAGLSPSVASDLWNNTRASIQTIERLCDKWKCPVSELLLWKQGKNPKRSLKPPPLTAPGKSRGRKR